MIRHMAYKFRLYANPKAESLFRRFAGCRRYVWNRALALQNERFERKEKRLTYPQLCKELTRWRNDPETAWLSEASVTALQQCLRDLDRAFVEYFKRTVAAPPRFKKKGKSRDSFRVVDSKSFAVDVGNGRVRLPKVGWVRYRNSRRVEGRPLYLTISRRAEHWYVSVAVEQDVPDPVHPHTGSEIGVDVGVVNFAAFSDGRPPVPPLNAFAGVRERLTGLQRRMARKKKFFSRWRKFKRKVERLHRKAADRRNDYLHQLTTAVSKSHATVYVEALRVKSMSASAKGTVEKPGKNVRQKAGLNRSILDQGWGEFRRQLGYKLSWAGGKLVEVPAAYTSQRCSRCGHTAKENRPTRDRFACVGCSLETGADDNAARNILAAGQAASMPAEGSVLSRGLEPRLPRPDEAGSNRGRKPSESPG